MINVLDLANYVIWKCEELKNPISNLKLQKLLYFIQVHYYGFFKSLAFDDDFEAWDYGPVVRSVYLEYCSNGYFNLSSPGVTSLPFSTEEEHCVVDTIIAHYSKFSASNLVEITHQKGGPWENNYTSGKKYIIPKDELKKYSEILWNE